MTIAPAGGRRRRSPVAITALVMATLTFALLVFAMLAIATPAAAHPAAAAGAIGNGDPAAGIAGSWRAHHGGAPASGDDRQRLLLASVPDLVLACVFLLAALYQIYTYLLLRRRVALWFGVLALAFTAFTLLDSPWVWELTASTSLVIRLHAAFAHLITASFLQFLWLFFRRSRGRLLSAYLLSHAALAAVVLLAPSAAWVLRSEPWRWLWILPCVGIMAWLGVDSLRRRHPDALTVGLGTLAAVAVGLVLVVGHVLGWGPSRMPEASWGFALFLFFFAAALGRRTARLTRELDAANRRLENRMAANQAALTAAQHRYRTLVDLNPVSVFLTTTEGKLLDVNRAFVELFRFPSRSAALGRDSDSLFADPAHRRQVLERHRRAEPVHGEEIEMVRADGSRFWALLSEAPTLEAGGSEEGAGGLLEATLVDVSEQRRARRALEESEHRYRQLVENSPGLICVHDLEGRLLSVNPAAARLLGEPAEEMAGRDLRHYLDPEVADQADAYLSETAREGEASGLMRVRTRRGDSRLVLFRTTVIDEPGRAPFALGFGQDVSDLKEAERELRTSLAAMRDLNRVAAAPGLTFRERVDALLDLGRQRFDLEAGVFCRLRGDEVETAVSRGAGVLADGGRDAPCRELCALAQRDPAVWERPERSPGGRAVTIGDRRAAALLASPLKVGGRAAGVLAFFDPAPRQRPFDAGDIEFLKLMALWLGAQLEQQQRTSDAGRLAEMSELLQSCGSLDEAHGVVAKLAAQFFPDFGGALLVERRGEGLVEVAAWGEGAEAGGGVSFTSADCWAARRGREHWVEDASTGLVCRHVRRPAPASFLCVPMMAMGDLVGVLHLWPRDGDARLVQGDRRLAASVAEHAALALANLELREDLRRQSIHDSLTGAFNRRHLDRRLLEECRRVTRTGEPLSLLLLDIDGFKAFNDTYGHQAGDRCLRRVAEALQRRLRRTGDLVARYGGEEFVATLPGTDAARAALLAEEVRRDIEELAVPDSNSPFGVVTVSIGASTWMPESADPPEPEALVASADRALYEAKAAGRNQVISHERHPD